MKLFDELKQNIAIETLCAQATIVSGSHLGAKLIVYPDAHVSGDLGDPGLNAWVALDARELMQREQSENRAYGDAEIFIEVYAPKPKLIIFGGVHTAIPLTLFAQALGFRVTIVDGRGRFATRERFPTADEIIVAWPDEAIAATPAPSAGAGVKIDSSTYVVILTHDPKFDIPALKALSTTRPRYIGSMGSRETRRQHFEELHEMGVSEEFLSRVHGPIGLDLGARSPEEMALAIMAEIVAVRYGREAGFLKSRGEERG